MLGWMKIEKKIFIFKACLVYKCLNDSAPIYLLNDFQYLGQYHDYSTRSASHKKLVFPSTSQYFSVCSLI